MPAKKVAGRASTGGKTAGKSPGKGRGIAKKSRVSTGSNVERKYAWRKISFVFRGLRYEEQSLLWAL
jgi:hypothetical protein